MLLHRERIDMVYGQRSPFDLGSFNGWSENTQLNERPQASQVMPLICVLTPELEDTVNS
jgi:hypothetical protein